MTDARNAGGALDATRSPKRILALDGGGIRGVLTLEYLGVIESLLRTRSGRPDLVLVDSCDLIGGTSTGSIIAAALACGKSVDELRTLYRSLGQDVFKSSFWKLPAAPGPVDVANMIGPPPSLPPVLLRHGFRSGGEGLGALLARAA